MTKDEFRRKVDSEVGARVATCRRSRSPRLSQDELADKTGGVLSRSAVANIERGRQRVAVYQLFVLAKALEVELAKLLPTAREVFAQERTETEQKVLKRLQNREDE